MATLILLRHGESEWNAKNLFTGWVDVDLTDKGAAEARRGGRAAARARPAARRGAHLACCAGRSAPPSSRSTPPTGTGSRCERSWRLNERHYGALQGKDKSRPWRSTARSSSCSGAARTTSRRRRSPTATSAAQVDDPRYAALPPELLPRTECLKDVLERVLPYWYDAIVPDLRAGATVLVAAHGNSLRAMVKHLDQISRRGVVELNIPTGIPLRYSSTDHLRPLTAGGGTSTPRRPPRPGRRQPGPLGRAGQGR